MSEEEYMGNTYDYKKIWTRNIDKIFFYDGRVKITTTDGNEYIGKSIGDCQCDENGEDVDGVRIKLENGDEIDLAEYEISSFEYLDGEPKDDGNDVSRKTAQQ